MIVVFGSVNLDVIHCVDTLPKPGETVLGRSLQTEAGGKGANQAVAAAMDGATVALAGAVGQDAAADIALAGLAAAGVDLSRVARTAEPTGLASILVDRAGQNQIAVGSGANLLARADQVADADLAAGTILVLQMEVDPVQNAALIRRASAHGAMIILNLAPAGRVDADVLRHVDWLVVNEAEAAWLGQAMRTGADSAALHHELCVNVVLTRGAQGVKATWDGRTWRLAAQAMSAADTTGAGDCFVGVFAAALDRGVTPAEALRRANVAAGLSCGREGSQRSFPSRADIDAAFPASPKPSMQQASVAI